VAGKGPAGKGLEGDAAGNDFQFGWTYTAAVGRANHGPDTGPRDEINGDLFFFQNLQDADVGDAAGEASAQGKTNARSAGTWLGKGKGRKA
jgi:hypothetical protein